MVNAVKHKYKTNYDKVKEAYNDLAKFKGKWEIENKTSGKYEVPENILSLEGVEYLLKLNIFNEVPSVLTYVAPAIVDYSILFKASDYSEAKFKEYVEKATELIENIIGAFKEFGIDLYSEATDENNLALCSKFYISYLATKIGKSEEYNLL